MDKVVHVWAASLNASREQLEQYEATLSSAELARAGQFRFAPLRARFITGRALLRKVLAQHLGTKPADLQFAYGRHGKPFLANFAPADLQFNLAHSEHLMLLAVTRVGPIGVDLERLRPLEEANTLVARFFSPRENAAFRRLPPEERVVGFYNLWTRKEAWLKATGEGIGSLLHRVEVSFVPGAPAQLVALPGDLGDASEWDLHSFSPAKGFVAAVAIRAKSVSVHCRQYTNLPSGDDTSLPPFPERLPLASGEHVSSSMTRFSL